MRRVIAEQSVSLDGFSAGPNVRVDNGLGDEGERLHDWMFRDARGVEIREEMLRGAGAFVMGRRMFDVGEGPWGDDPPFHAPVFVITHRPKDPVVKRGGTTYAFVTGGVTEAVAHAKAAAGDRDIAVVGGAETIRQAYRAGLLDELRIHLVPIFLGAGTRLFERLTLQDPALEPAGVEVSAGVTHLAYRVERGR